MARFKRTTGIAGLEVVKHPEYILQKLYQKILLTLEKMPEDAKYRQITESLVKKRLDIVCNPESIECMEKKINCGQIEEVIIQARNELNLARRMLTWKPWEPLINKPPPNQWTWPPVA